MSCNNECFSHKNCLGSKLTPKGYQCELCDRPNNSTHMCRDSVSSRGCPSSSAWYEQHHTATPSINSWWFVISSAYVRRVESRVRAYFHHSPCLAVRHARLQLRHAWRSVTFKQNPQPTERPRGRRVLYELLLHLIQPRRSNAAVVAIVIVGALRQRHARRPARVGAIDFVLKHKPSVMNAPLKSCFRFGRDSPLCARQGSPTSLPSRRPKTRPLVSSCVAPRPLRVGVCRLLHADWLAEAPLLYVVVELRHERRW